MPVAVVDELGKIYLAHHGWHHMTVLQVEVVIGTIEVGRHHGDIVGAILQVVALAHLQTSYLGNGIFLVGILEWRGEEHVFLHRLWCILRIDAGRTQEEQLLHAV